jgi:hypothetical protein
MNLADAKARAQEYIDNLGEDVPLKLVEDATIEKTFGWVFFYNSAKYLESGSFSDALMGNAPIIVGRDGAIHVTGTAHPIEHYLSEFERLGTIR